MEQEQEKSTEMCSENTADDGTPDDPEQVCTIQSAPGVTKITNASPKMLAEIFKTIFEERSKYIEENTCEPLPEIVEPEIENSITVSVNIPKPTTMVYYKEGDYYTDAISSWPTGTIDVIIDQNQKFWFYGCYIASMLHYKQCRRAVAIICKHQQYLSPYASKHLDSGNVIVPESDVIRLIGYAQFDGREEIKYDFADWLFYTALPDIRAQYCYPKKVDSNKPLPEKLRDYAEILEKMQQLRNNILTDLKESNPS